MRRIPTIRICLLAATLVSGCASVPLAASRAPDVPATAGSLQDVAASQSIDLASPLSPDTLAAIAVYTNPDLQALRAQEGVAEAQVFAAGLFPDPTFSVGFDTPLNGTGLITALSAGLGYDFAALARRPSDIRIAQARLESLRNDIVWAEWLTGQQARLNAVRVAHLNVIGTLTADLRRLASEELIRALSASSRGDLPAASIEARRIGASDAAERDRTNQSRLQLAQLELNRVLGIDPAEKLSLALPADPPVVVPPVTDLFQTAIADRPDFAALRAGLDGSNAAQRQAALAAYPLPAISINAARDTGNLKTLGPSLSFTLPIWNRGRGDLAIARASDAQLRAEYAARAETLRADIAAAWSAYHMAREQLDAVTGELAPLEPRAAADEAAAARGDISFSAASATRLIVLDKQIVQSELALAAAEFEIALELSSGRLLEPAQ